ncbi:serpin-ZX [Artemisia annua]|uniref:Serpin-ZX n=1 Tax=Artemisia annua TaxID=35608 RepID=A0A2U1MS99_ARTAN|nr:serpin-ZX [Artemisia annua]
MAEERRRKISANTTTSVITKTLLDDAHNGFKNGNFVCSPLSLDIVLGMLTVGAEGKTLKQLLGFLRHGSIDQFLSESPSSKLLAKSLLNRNNLEFSLVNGVWVDEKVKLQARYQRILETVYKTEARCTDFKDEEKLNEAVEKINSWVKEKTKGLIPSIVKTSDFKMDAFMVLVNALYFKGAWYEQFTAEWTRNREFYLINGGTVSVPFMTLYEKSVKYRSFNGYKMIRFPYKSNDRSNKFSMYIFLPDRRDGLQHLLELFHSDDDLFHGDFNLKRETLASLWIPKFKISTTFEPEDVMKELGLTLPFEKTNTEFSGIVEKTGLDDDMIYVSKILQKFVIEVDKRGTEAASCTMMMETFGCIPTERFVADHPFMFMIREDTYKAVLFVGAVLNPPVN